MSDSQRSQAGEGSHPDPLAHIPPEVIDLATHVIDTTIEPTFWKVKATLARAAKLSIAEQRILVGRAIRRMINKNFPQD